jgi:hypothetical protein
MINKIPILILSVIPWLSCNTVERDDNQTKTENKDAIKYIKFDFAAKNINSPRQPVEVNATLYNEKTDTIFFLTTSCDGGEEWLSYDTTKFVLTPFWACQGTYLIIEKIAPNGQYKFKAHFENKAQSSTIKLGFDFYKVDKNFDLEKADSNIPYDKQREKNIIWSDEKQIDK